MTDESYGAYPSHPGHPTYPTKSAGFPSPSELRPAQPEARLPTPADTVPVSPSPGATGSQDPQPHRISLRRRTLVLGAAGVGALIVGGAILVRYTTGCRSSPTPITTGSPASVVYRPTYHYSPATGNLADPNGLVLYEGKYHLFHQQDGTWSHVISSNMMCWKRQGTALEYDVQGLAMPDSCVVDEADTPGLVTGGGMAAVCASIGGGETRSLAYSTDRGRSWRRFSGNPVVLNDGCKDFRDPRVFWHKDSKAQIMIVSAGDHAPLSRSTDFRAWSYASNLGQDIGSHAAVWECPDLFPLTDSSDGYTRWVMTPSVDANEETADPTVQYFIGDFDGSAFFSEDRDTRLIDVGQDFYAAQNFEHVEGRCVWMTRLDNWNHPYPLPTGDWRGKVSTPRELLLTTVGGKRTLAQKPVPELSALRGRAADLSGCQATDTVTALNTSRTVKVDLTLDVSHASEAWLGLAYGTVDGKTQEVCVGVNISVGTLYPDRTDGGLTQVDGRDGGTTTNFTLCHQTQYRPTGSVVRLHLYLNRSSLEVFVGDGTTVGSLLVFTASSCQEIALGAQDTTIIMPGSFTPPVAVLQGRRRAHR